MTAKKKAARARKSAVHKPAARRRRRGREPSYALSRGGIDFKLDPKAESVEAVFGAAYLMMDVAFVRLNGDRTKTLGVRLEPKAGLALDSLARRFLDELSTQRLRWAIARENLPVREFIAEQAVLLASGRLEPVPAPAAEAAPDVLTDEQRAEIEKLIAEVEDEIKTMNATKAGADPKGVRASWEEKHEAAAETEKKA